MYYSIHGLHIHTLWALNMGIQDDGYLTFRMWVYYSIHGLHIHTLCALNMGIQDDGYLTFSVVCI